MAQNTVIVAGQTLDFSVLSMQDQLQIVDFFNFLNSKKQKNTDVQPSRINNQGQKILTLDELFNTVKGQLPADYKFDREEANAR